MATEGKVPGIQASSGTASVRYIEVSEEEAGQRLDNFLLARLKGVPKSRIYKVIRGGEVRVNSGRIEAAYRVAAGDRIRVPPIRVAEREDREAAPHFKMPVLFEDDAILAIDKPSGLAVHGGSGVAHGVIESLRSMRPDARFLELVHRLDRETSGILLLAKKRSALTTLHAALRERDFDKRYLAAVSGRFRNELQRVKLALSKRVTGEGDKRVSVSEDGQPAETILRRLARGPEFSLLEAEILTGRTHQIRVHLAHLGHPILGDDKYGDFELNRALRKRGLKRMFLHAAGISFSHPLTGAAVAIESPLPPELEAFRQGMHRYELIVFDWDGTIMDSTGHIASCLQEACRDIGIAIPSEFDAKFVIGLNLADTLRHVAPGLDAEGGKRLTDRFRTHFMQQEHTPVFAGIPEMLAELKERGHRLAVATGKARRGLDSALVATGLAPFFEASRCADEGFAKPHPGMLHALLDITGVEAANTVMIGDTTHDLELAANAGVDAIAVLYGAHDAALLSKHPARARCATVAELRTWLTAPAA